MVRFTRNMRPRGLLRTVLCPFLWGLVVLVFVSLFGALIYGDTVGESSLEQDILLFAKEGRVEVESHLAIATEIRKAAAGDMSIDEFAAVISDKNLSYSRVVTAIKLMPSVKKIVDNPALYESLRPPVSDWGGFLKFIIWAFIIISIVLINGGFAIMSIDYDSGSNPDRRNLATYPWHKLWGWAIAPVLAPWLIISQPIWFIVWVIMNVRSRAPEDKRKEARRIEKEKQQADDREKGFIKEIDGVKKEAAKNKRAYLSLMSESMKDQEEKFRSELNDKNSRLDNLAREMENTERDIARKEAEILRIRDIISQRSSRSVASVNEEFDKILRIPGVAAVRIKGCLIEVMTEKVIIEYKGLRYEIGRFKIDLDAAHSGIKVMNRTNTARGTEKQHPYAERSGSFCFGSQQGDINKFFEVGDYYSLIATVLKAMRSADGDNPDGVMNWKVVGKVGKKRKK